jgi:argininosuccinate synthase
MSDRRR